jgi:hypothetical protein
MRYVWPVLVLLFFFLFPSFYALNFGIQWDEPRAKFDSVRDSVDTGVFMQVTAADPEGKNYNHGGLNYFLTWAGFAPELVKFFQRGEFTREALSDVIRPVIYDTSVRVRVRRIYLLLSALSIVWLYCLCLVLGRSRLESFLAAGVLSGSWEVAYHSRFVAPDMIMMQFELLSFLCLAIAFRTKRLGWFYAGAIAAGLAIGTKYTGGIVMPFFAAGAAVVLWQQTRSVRFLLKHIAGLLITTGVVFVITTPGVLLDPFRFFGQLAEQREIYGSSWYGYTVTPGLRHFGRILEYFLLQLFSHYWGLSVILAAVCLVGIVALVRERTLFNVLAVSFVLAYIVYFSQQAVMIVRNVLVVAPFFAAAAARGIIVIAQRCGSWKRALVYAVVGGVLAANVAWQIYAALETKKRYHLDYFAKEFVRYVEKSPAETIFVSRKLSNAISMFGLVVPGNLVTGPSTPYTKVAFFQSEGADKLWESWPSNWWGMYDKTFGPLEVNLEAYSTFVGNERILVVSAEKFKKLPLTEKDLAP